MKQRKVILTVAAITALFSAGGCDLNSNVCVYGPPPDDYTTAHRPVITEPDTESTEETATSSETVELYEPETNITAGVYGPPSDFNAAETPDTSETGESSETAETADTTQEVEYE